MVEFALVFPIFFTLLISIIEFSLVYNAQLSVNFATREAALIAAEAGNTVDGDCAILRSIEDAMSAPTSDDQITQVVIYRSDTVGNPVPVGAPQQNLYARGGAKPCPRPGNATATVAFSLVGVAGYPEVSRCNTIAGCGSGRPLDHVGVRMTYVYTWHTPLATLIGLGGTGYIMVGSNAMRMEPIL
jgi:Flp pilus assembly protein TadG